MMLHSHFGFLALAIAALASGSPYPAPVDQNAADPSPAAAASAPEAGVCPDPSKCYRDTIGPVCKPGQPCPQWLRPVVACSWKCDGGNPPLECTRRCKPCKAEICSLICECEIVCPVPGPCKLND
ncbi:hypothetical protein GGI23_001204 [Coemansia sp. RSA 2559]|nr:hypothetical protein GGI23_001204 [Coemansia sp. RSA 2559]